MSGFYWNPWAMAYFLAFLVAFSLAGLVLAIRGGQIQNRLLALLLILDGSAMGWSGLLYSTYDVQTAWAAQALITMTYFTAPFAYLLLASTLRSPPSRLLKNPLARGVLTLGALSVVVLVLGWEDRFYGSMFEASYSHQEATLGPWFALSFKLAVIPLVYALSCAVWAALGSARGSQQRVQATWFAGAFAVRDVSLLTFNLLAAGLLVPESRGPLLSFVLLLPPIAVVGASSLLAYGILKHQLFDIDLKIKWTLSRGTLAGIFLVVFLVVSQLIERVASEKLGYLSGAVAAGVLLFTINPLQKAADKLADKAMPRTDSSPAYVTFRKMEVYKAAVEEMLADGTVSAKDRRVLDRLRTQLGLAASDAGSMESDIAAMRGVA